MDFEQLVKDRHSAVNFFSDFDMTEEDFKKIFDLAKLAPSTYNLQSTNYLVVLDKRKKELIYDLSYKQHKIKTASAVVIVLGDKSSLTLSSAEKIYSPMKALKMMSEEDYEAMLSQVEGYVSLLNDNPYLMNTELNKVCSINATFFMLAAKHYGFDTCPMHTQNNDKLREEFNIPQDKELIMMITIGKATFRVRPRGYRKVMNEVVKFNSF